MGSPVAGSIRRCLGGGRDRPREDAMKAKEFMNPEVVSVAGDMPVQEVARLLTERGISGVPVVEEGELIGIITLGDLVDRVKRIHLPTVLTLLDAIIPIAGEHQFQEELRRMAAVNAVDIMTPDPLTVDEETELSEVATRLSERHISLLPVVRDGALVGIIGKRDIIRAMLVE